MKPAHERDRDTALMVARGRARRGDEEGAARWFALAGTFALPTRRQEQAHEAAIAAGRRGVVIAGQLDIEGREVGSGVGAPAALPPAAGVPDLERARGLTRHV